MKFDDYYEEQDFEHTLKTLFHYVEPGARSTGDFAGLPYDGFYWRSCVLHEGDLQGTQGYLMVWFDNHEFRSFHTYHYPPDIYS